MTISKEALEYVVELGTNEIEILNGQTYARHGLTLIKQPTASPFTVRSLSGLIGYLKSGFDGDNPILVHVVSPTEVVAFGALNDDKNRDIPIKASALLPEFSFGRWYGTEEFIINLQAGFMPNGDRDTILKVVGNLQEENVSSYGDDGVSQKVTAKSGVASVEDVKVPNPVVLRPFRTFVEVDQPQSEFIFRMRTGPSSALFDADGGAWKLVAMDNIRAYLEAELVDAVTVGSVTIIA